MVAVSRGGMAHLYLNLAGREPGGVVAPSAAPDLLRRAARRLHVGVAVGDAAPVIGTGEGLFSEIVDALLHPLELAGELGISDRVRFTGWQAPGALEHLLDEESQDLAELEQFIGRPIKLQAEVLYNQEQYDVVLI